MITYIVSAFDRPAYLRCCLASLALQNDPNEIIIACNATDERIQRIHHALAVTSDAKYLHTASLGATECYDAIEIVVNGGYAHGDWLCFPSDDSYYVPKFSEIMLHAARANNWDLVYCNMLYDSRSIYGAYNVFPVDPWPCSIDKTCFMVKRDRFIPFPGKVPGGASASDGLFVQELVRQGVPHGKAPGVLVVHN